jgi:DNA (cytosine-5)-methyltransferase 1
MRVFSTFTGIGGFEIGIENAYRSQSAAKIKQNREGRNGPAVQEGVDVHGGSVPPLFVGYSEIDKYATKVYDHHFKGVKNYGDITKINADELPDFDCLVGGFPCQAFSIAGKRGGFTDTRGTLFFDLARILSAKRPRLFVFENVKGLLSHDDGKTFRTIITAIDELGYDAQWQVINSKNHGVPQNRERIIIVGHLRGTPRPQVFPLGATSESDIVLPTLTTRYYGAQANGGYISHQQAQVGTLRTHKDGNGFRPLKSGLAPTIPARAREDGSGQPVILTGSPKYGNGKREVQYKESDISPTIRATHYKSGDNQPVVAVLTPNREEKRQNGRRFKTPGEPAFTVNTQDQHGIYDGVSIRRLTPLECERLQAFPDNWTAIGTNGPISDSQRYKMCGNAVTTNVIQAVFEQIFASQEVA